MIDGHPPDTCSDAILCTDANDPDTALGLAGRHRRGRLSLWRTAPVESTSNEISRSSAGSLDTLHSASSLLCFLTAGETGMADEAWSTSHTRVHAFEVGSRTSRK